MIKPEMVPYNATREALTAWMGSEGTIMSAMERAIAAALNAWPGMATIKEDDRVTVAAVYLPIAQKQEDGDGK